MVLAPLSPRDFYYLLMGFAVIAQTVIYLVVTSRLGRAMRAIKLNEGARPVAGHQSIELQAPRLALSAFLAGVVGGLFVFYLTIVDPSIFDFYYTETMLIMVIIGGPGSFWGVLGASAVLAALPDLLRFTTDLRMVLYGAVLIAAMLVFPGGVGRLAPATWPFDGGDGRTRLPHDAPPRGDGAHQAVSRIDRGGQGGVRGGGGHGGGADRPERLGKSTIVDCLSGFQPADGGQWRLDGRALTGLPAHRIARAGLTRTFQTVRAYDELTLLDNLRVAAQERDGVGWLPVAFPRPAPSRGGESGGSARPRTARHRRAGRVRASAGGHSFLRAAQAPRHRRRHDGAAEAGPCSTSRWPASTPP
jgi:hypothetical protein